MSISSNVIRARTVEAVNLSTSLPALGLSRQIVRALRLRTRGRTFIISPTTGLVAEAGVRLGLTGLAIWVHEIAAVLSSGAHPARFLSYFARPIRIDDLPSVVVPTALLLDLAWLRDGLVTEYEVSLVGPSGRERQLDAPAVRAFVEQMMEIGTVDFDPTSATGRVSFPGVGRNYDFVLRQNKASFSLVERRLARLRIKDLASGEVRSLAEAIRDERSLFVTTNDLRFAYAYGQLFEDQRVGAQARAMTGIVEPEAALARCISEKGIGKAGPDCRFAKTSVFGVIERKLAHDDDFLVCDDLGDEWADYIGVRRTPPRITLYHAKHGALSDSTSAFQEVLGQATKNVARLAIVAGDLARKKTKWAGLWGKPGMVRRVRKGGAAKALCAAYVEAAANPNVSRRICVVTSFASASAVRRVLRRASNGRRLPGHHAQLVWFLSSFVHTCLELGAEARVICQP